MTVLGAILSPGRNVICVCLDSYHTHVVFLTRQGKWHFSPFPGFFFAGYPVQSYLLFGVAKIGFLL